MKIKKTMVYSKLFIVYTLIIIFLIGSLDVYFTKNVIEDKKETMFSMNEKVINDVKEQLKDFQNESNLIVNNIYNDYEIITDVMDFLSISKTEYIERKLDKLCSSKRSYYKGIEYFTRCSFKSNSFLESIDFVSYKRKEISSFSRESEMVLKKLDDISMYTDSKMLKNNYICYTRELRNPMTLESEGNIIFKYKLTNIKEIIKKYDENYEIMILSKSGQIVYDSNNKNESNYYEHFEELVSGTTKENIESDYYINSILDSSGITIVGKIEKTYANRLNINFFISLIFIDLCVFLVGELIFFIKFKKLNDRMNNILVAMDKVKNGEINVCIPIGKEMDEINLIAQNFNDMCKKLDEYIKKSYLEELNNKQALINQKKAEMMALQSQINPHFLYNTLESIRMKAICNGDKEVGKMIYILAFLFRSQLKDKNIISIKNEIEYCKKYLEIYKFRYEDKFEFKINYEEELLEKQIIKFTIQPLIENYFVHGIRLENNDNKLLINIFKSEDIINIIIEDNGKGMSKEQIEYLNVMLIQRSTYGTSIGMSNANERIAIEYGQTYGIRLDENTGRGTKIIVKIPCKGVSDNAKSYDS